MSQETAAAVQAICGIFSGAAAIVAIVIAMLVERRTNQRFSQQLQREETLAIANLKPLISVYPSKFIDHKAITLCNYGLGTAVITDVTFSKGDIVEKKALFKLFSFPQQIIWDYYWIFREKRYYIQAGQKIKLLELTEKGLAEDGRGKKEIQEILESLQQQMGGVKINIECSDILGNKQDVYEITLTA